MSTGPRKRPRDEDLSDGDVLDVDLRSTYGNQTLPVADLPRDFDGIPLDGAQYLAVVRHEAYAAPQVTRDGRYTSPSPLVTKVNGHADQQLGSNGIAATGMPSEQWRDAFLFRFRNMREALKNVSNEQSNTDRINLPAVNNVRQWFRFLHGTEPKIGGDILNASDARGHAPKRRSPTPALLRRIQTSRTIALLSHIIVWLEEGWHDGRPEESSSRPIAIDPFLCQWLFALLAHLEERLNGDDISTLRQVARCCLGRILQARQAGYATTLEAPPADERGAWLVICSIIGIWGQHDLWDDARTALRSTASYNDTPSAFHPV